MVKICVRFQNVHHTWRPVWVTPVWFPMINKACIVSVIFDSWGGNTITLKMDNWGVACSGTYGQWWAICGVVVTHGLYYQCFRIWRTFYHCITYRKCKYTKVHKDFAKSQGVRVGAWSAHNFQKAVFPPFFATAIFLPPQYQKQGCTKFQAVYQSIQQ